MRDIRNLTRGLAVLALAWSSACTFWSGESDRSPRQERGAGETGVAYVDSQTCAACHQPEYQAWSGSHHDLAMQEATAETVSGDFNDAAFTHFGVTSRFFTRDGRFFVNTEGPDGELADFEIQYTFGVEPLQQYLAEFPGGRLQSLTIAWDAERNEWFHLYPDERIRPGDPLHWTGRYQSWNVMCADCHSTNLRKNYDSVTDTYRTVWDELNVGCQACHGPGNAHIEWANQGHAAAPDAAAAGLVVDLGTAESLNEIESCAGCHSRRLRINHVDRHARPFLDDSRPATLRDGLYHPDGQIRDEVYVWGSFVQSRMHQAGVRCSNCHEPHSLSLRAEGNALCLQCHRETPVERFPTLQPKRYDSPEHHFHDAESEGAQCVNCHMPAQLYMVVDSRRDHSFRVPRPDLSVSLGTPNACTMCHTDESAEWATAHAETWWGVPEEPHFAEVIAPARAGDREAEAGLVDLAGDQAQPAIVRATALEQLRQYGPLGLQAIVTATTDEDALVRATAVGGLELASPERRVAVLAPLLDDPIRAVRIEAARVLASVPATELDAPQRESFEAALAEFVDAQMAGADMPAAHLNLGVLHVRNGELEEAEREYQTALRFDPYFLPARFNLVNLYNQQGRNDEAETLLREGIDRTPEEGELHYSLGLLLAEEQRLEEAATSLGRAAELIPTRARVRYNYGLALQQLGRLEQADAALVEASAIDPGDPDILLALAQLLMDRREWDRAREYARALRRLNPTAPGPGQLLNEIQIRELQERQ